jgi:hypothetical protein
MAPSEAHLKPKKDRRSKDEIPTWNYDYSTLLLIKKFLKKTVNSYKENFMLQLDRLYAG